MLFHRRPLALAAILACLAAAPAAASIEEGVQAWQKGDYAAAVGEWRPFANRGNAIAQFNMGQAYRYGRGVPADTAIARSWFEKAAQQGHQEAQAALGLLLFQSGDRKTAMYWIRKAADRGDPRAQYALATAHFNGDGVARDWPRAYALMSRAAAAGVPQAKQSLAHMDKHMLRADREKGADLARQMEKGTAVGGAGGGTLAVAAPRLAFEPEATADMRVLSAPPIAVAAAKPAPAPAPKAATPKPEPAAAAARAPAASPGGRWRVQLGAYANEAEARSRWTALARRIGALGGLTPSYERFGRFTRLRVGPLAGKADATRLCASARASGQDCFIVSP